MKKKTNETKTNSGAKLWNFSAYATVHTKAAGEPAYGYTMSGYRTNANGEREYINLWLPADMVIGKRKNPDGTFGITIAFAEIKVKNHAETAAARDDNDDVPF